MEGLTEKKALETIKQLVFKGIPQTGSFDEVEAKRQTVEKLFETLENALDLNKKEDGE